MNDLKSRYLNDPIFHTVVDHMRAIIRAATLTPSEVREAAMTACVIEEMYNPRPPLSTSDEELEIVRSALASSELAGRPGTRDVQSRPAADGGKKP